MKTAIPFFCILLLFFCGCKSEEKNKDKAMKIKDLKQISEVYVCPMECDNGMNYYLEGKCDICHMNLIKE